MVFVITITTLSHGDLLQRMGLKVQVLKVQQAPLTRCAKLRQGEVPGPVLLA